MLACRPQKRMMEGCTSKSWPKPVIYSVVIYLPHYFEKILPFKAPKQCPKVFHSSGLKVEKSKCKRILHNRRSVVVWIGWTNCLRFTVPLDRWLSFLLAPQNCKNDRKPNQQLAFRFQFSILAITKKSAVRKLRFPPHVQRSIPMYISAMSFSLKTFFLFPTKSDWTKLFLPESGRCPKRGLERSLKI